MKDKVMAGAIVGLLADIIKLFVNYICFYLGWVETVFWQITATRFLNGQDLFKPVAYLVGGIVDLTTSAFLGVIFIYFLDFTGHRFIWFKGAGYGLLVWVGLFGTVLAQSVEQELPTGPLTILVTCFAHFIFGLSLAFFSKMMYGIEAK